MPISTLDELKAYYPAQLILQYRGKIRWTQLIQAIVQEAWLDGLIQTEASCFDIETAVGEQLDVLGRIVGINREVYGLDLEHIFWELTDYSGSPVGVDMQSYSDTTPGPEVMKTYRSNAIYTMTEFEMRTSIKLKIIYNNVQRSTKSITDALWELFADGVEFIDNKDMTTEMNVSAAYANVFKVAEFLGFIPKPMGVECTINYV